MIRLLVALLILPLSAVHADPSPTPRREKPPGNRVASVAVSQTLINELLATQLKSEMVEKLKVALDPDKDWITISGVTRIPVEELRAINLEPTLGKFHFNLVAKLSTTPRGHLILEFPLNQTYFYPLNSRNPEHDRVIVPVQMLSIALASIRGYLAALSGDFDGFDRRAKKLESMIRSLDHSIATEKDPSTKEDLKTERDSLKLQLAGVPLERKQLQNLSKQVVAMLGFTGEKELNLNNELAAHRNALILKIRLSQLAPYLTGVNLGAIRVWRDKREANAETYLSFDVNAELEAEEVPEARKPRERTPMKVPPSVMIRLKQTLFKSKALTAAGKDEMPSNLRDLDLQFQDDGLHVSGRWKTFLFFSVGFDIIVDFTSTATDEFEVRVRESNVAGIDFGFVKKYILKTLKERLDEAMKGVFKFKYVGEDEAGARALRVMVDPKMLIPTFPGLHLVGVDVRPGEFLLKIGRAPSINK